VVAQVWPVGIANIGSKTYFIFMAINLACIPIVYLFYPETKQRTLEDMEVLFNRNSSESTTSLHDPAAIDNKSQVGYDAQEV
jgi:hypothetical protein